MIRLRVFRNEARDWVYRVEERIVIEEEGEAVEMWSLVIWGRRRTQLFARRKGRREMWKAWLSQISRPSPTIEEVWSCLASEV